MGNNHIEALGKKILGISPRKTVSFEIINSGSSKHRHKLTELKWDNKFGDQVANFSEYSATFKTRLGCTGCNYEIIESERALY